VKTVSTSKRRRNRRGEGERLRAEIVAGASALLEETGSEEAITLRGIARQVGIAAPSIYGHFADTDEILQAVIAQAFEAFDEALERADNESSQADRLLSLCRAYLRFARENPHVYRVMFGRHRNTNGATVNRTRPVDELSGAQAFERLVGSVCAHTGRSPDDGSLRDATILWVGLHGYVSLLTAVPAFPWPPPDDMVETLVARFVGRAGTAS
jgi:AcrR family transcriptional regulator